MTKIADSEERIEPSQTEWEIHHFSQFFLILTFPYCLSETFNLSHPFKYVVFTQWSCFNTLQIKQNRNMLGQRIIGVCLLDRSNGIKGDHLTFRNYLTLVLLNQDISSIENSVDPDQMASEESTLFFHSG